MMTVKLKKNVCGIDFGTINEQLTDERKMNECMNMDVWNE